MEKSKNQHKLNLIISSATMTHSPSLEAVCRKGSNLFKHQSLQKLKNIEFQQSKPYQYVGIKELKSFYQRTRRFSRENKRLTITGSFLTHKLSTLSNISRVGPATDLLTKNQVLQTKQKEREHLLTHIVSKGQAEYRYTVNQSFIDCSSRLNSSCENEGYSLEKIKEKLKKYEYSWCQIEEKCQRIKGFPSLLRQVDNQRDKQLSKQKSSLDFQKTRIHSRMWEKALREPQGICSIYKKKGEGEVRLNKKAFGVLGRSKLSKETDWISSKQNEGCRFKPIKEQT